MHMNLKALITTFVLGSSTMASADSVTFTGSVSVNLGGSTSARPAPMPAPAPVVVRDHRVVAQDPCATPAPAPAPVVVYQPPAPRPVIIHQPPQPVWSGPFYDPHNTRLGGDSSSYTGTWGHSAIKFRPVMNRGNWYGYQTRTPTQSWFEMTEATRIDNGRLFMHPRDNGYYRALKIQTLGNGGSNIVQVRIDFKDKLTGKKGYQIVKLNQRLDRNHQSLTIDLDGDYRQLERIIVYGQTDRGSAIKLLAM
jgi:hypothetical protein